MALETNSVQPSKLLCIYIPLDLLKALVSSPKIVHPKHKTCSSLAINMFVCNVICICRRVAKTIFALAMNAFVCSVKSYSEVSSRDYFIASDKRVRLLLESWFRNPQKRTETKGKSCCKKLHFKLGLDL